MNTRSLSVIARSIRLSGRGGKLAWTCGIIALLLLCLTITDTITDKTAEDQIAELFEGYNETGLVKLYYTRAGSSLFGDTVTVSGISMEAFGSSLDADELVLYDYRLNEQGLPIVLKARLRGIVIDPGSAVPTFSQRRELSEMLADIGYSGPTEGEIFVDWSFNREESLTELRRISLKIEEAGRLELKGELIGLGGGVLALLVPGMGNTIPVRIGSLELEYRDDSLLSRILRHSAEQKGSSTDELVDELRVRWERDQGLQVLFADELEQFLKNPRSLRIRIHPETPVTMTQIGAAGSPQELADLLDFRLEAN